MVLTQILESCCVRVPLQATNKQQAITELVDILSDNGFLSDRDCVLQAVLTREQTRSTGIGSGIAIPHGKCNGVKDLVMAIGISHSGIDFQSIDNLPVHIIVLLASPVDRTGPHIQALARISRLMLDADFKAKLESAQSSEELYELISSKETE